MIVMGEEPKWEEEEKEVKKEEEGRRMQPPPWLEPLLTTKFFVQCKVHMDSSHRSECNMFCLDCTVVDNGGGGALCSVCISHAHRHHRTIQIRRSSYHDVIRAGEIQKELDISGVQTYVINSAKVVFLNPRPQTRPPKPGAHPHFCLICFRSLVDSFRFCSLACKIAGTTNENHFKKKGKKEKMNASDTESYAGSSQESGRSTVVESYDPSTPTSTAVSYQTVPVKRRKGIPHRSPFGGLLLEV